MEYREHKRLHASVQAQESSFPERLILVARELYDNLTSGMRRPASGDDKRGTLSETRKERAEEYINQKGKPKK